MNKHSHSIIPLVQSIPLIKLFQFELESKTEIIVGVKEYRF